MLDNQQISRPHVHDGVENGSEICTVGTTRSRDQRSFDTEFLTERSMFAPLSPISSPPCSLQHV